MTVTKAAPKQVGYYLLRSTSDMGRSADHVECGGCFEVRNAYIWSWAGHGFFVCRGCGAHVMFGRRLP